MIPARYQASRFPGKLMKDLSGKPVILRTYEAALQTELFDEVYVVTDSDIIYNTIHEAGGKVMKSKKEHECGSDRLAEASENIHADIIVNVQGDEPFIKPKDIKSFINFALKNKKNVTNAYTLIKNKKNNDNVNIPKLVLSKNENLLYMSRSAIPGSKNNSKNINIFKTLVFK